MREHADVAASFLLNRGMPLSTLFAATATACGSSVLIFYMLPGRAKLEKVGA